MRIIPVLCFLLLLATPIQASDSRLTVYLDGALMELEAVTVGKTLEISLPAAMSDGTLRVQPLGSCRIDRVEIVPARPDPKLAKEAARLAERKEVLGDRLQTLETREAIYKAAAKSQSGKAPRKTKTNPDPLAAVKQGTEYAMTQLEAVYRARRKTDKELQAVEARLAAVKKDGLAGGRIARIRLARKGGRIRVTYFRSDLKWTPLYDFRLEKSGEVDIALRAHLPKTGAVATVRVVPASFSESSAASLSVPAEEYPSVAAFTFPAEREQFSALPVSSLSFYFRNLSNSKLPAGEASCYRRGEYLGTTAFGGSLPNEVKEVVCGR